MSTRRAESLLALLALIAACQPSALPEEGQLLVHIETDAPLPSARSDAEPALFDRVRIEVVPPAPDALPCPGCTREFPLTRELVAERRASFGFVPARHGGARVRVRMHRAAWLANGEPPAATTLETVALLPAAPVAGIADITVTLWLADVGRPQGSLDAPVPATAGPPASPALAVADVARRTRCPAPPEAGEACVPGGAIWMGDPAIATLGAGEVDGYRPRVISLSPFYVDLREVSVAEYRRANLPDAGGPLGDPREGGPCSFTTAPGPRDGFPITCITFAKAKAYCASRGRLVPSEAQFEYLASGLVGRPYSWGRDAPECKDAIYGRNALADATERTKACLASGSGPAAPGSGERDRLPLEGGEVVDLNGNVAEWTLDEWQPETGSCWGPGLLRDPLCTIPAEEQTVRGGSWALFDILTRAQIRTRLPRAEGQKRGDVGFRCVRPAR